MKKEIKTLGNCQCCGRLQAVLNGHSAKHGYTVKDGWFQGVCQGHKYPSMQTNREVTDEIVLQVLADVAVLQDKLKFMKAGKIRPEMVEVGSKRYLGNGQWSNNLVPYADAPEYAQRDGIQTMIFQTESRIRAGQNFASNMTGLVNRVHGTPLIEEKKPVAAAKIQSGEKRTSESGSVLTASYQDGARVYWKRDAKDGRVATGWMASRSWRALSLVE